MRSRVFVSLVAVSCALSFGASRTADERQDHRTATTTVLPSTAVSAPRTPEASAEPQPVDLLIGDWVGALDAGDEVLHLALHVRRGETTALVATIDSPDQGAMGIKVQTVGLVDEGLMLDITSIGARFDGVVARNSIKGRWAQGGETLPLTFKRGVAKAPAAPATQAAPSDPIRPLWMGTLEVPGGKVRLVLHLARDAEGRLSGTIDSLDQAVHGIRVDDSLFKDGKLTLEMKALDARFEGIAGKDATELTGQWTQAAKPVPLVLKAIDKIPAD